MTGSVVVVGAGIAGLTAAHDLSRAGWNVVTLEASDRIGGRMSTERRDGYVIDRGAQFLSDGYDTIFDLIGACGLSREVCTGSEWIGVVRDGQVRRMNVRRPWTVATSGLLGWRDTLRVMRATVALTARTRRLPLNDYSKWQTLDQVDAAAWIADSFGAEALESIFEPMLEGLYFQPPEGMSRAWPAIAWSFGVRRKRIATLSNGIGSLAEAMAQKLDVHLRAPVEAIDTTEGGVRVRSGGEAFDAEYAIVATTASVARKLRTAENDHEQRLLDTTYSAGLNISVTMAPGFSATDVYGILIPRRERRVIASIAIESQKCPAYARRSELLNVMLSGVASSRLRAQADADVLAEVLPDLDRVLPGAGRSIESAKIYRWPEAEPRSPIGRSRDIAAYRQRWRPDMKVLLAGDYMGIPCTEGAAESGRWAATALIG